MSAFTGPLAIREHDVDADTWELCEVLVWEVGALGSGNPVIVPAGFVSDGASIPWPLSIVLPRWGRWRRAACLHDFLCEHLRSIGPHPFVADQKAADAQFYDAMLACGCWKVTALLFWLAVRIFGANRAARSPTAAKVTVPAPITAENQNGR